tara:strand:+ start:4564 stop:4995 length:432 start_codon:yes stop_codon:yes gene_type:complete
MIPKRYLSGLSKKDKLTQKKNIMKARKSYKSKKLTKKYVPRLKLKSFKSKTSSWTQKFHDMYPGVKTIKDISKVVGISKKALLAVKKKGMGAYYSSGSRPNQTAQSWGLARMYSYILGGKTRKIDREITKKYAVRFKHKSSMV